MLKRSWKILWRDGQGSEIWETPCKILFCQKQDKKFVFFRTLQEAIDYVQGIPEIRSFLKHCERIRNDSSTRRENGIPNKNQ